jgi:parallel beta-helix repeat protein
MKLSTKLFVGIAIAAAVLLTPVAVCSLYSCSGGTSESSISKTNDLAAHEQVVIQDASDFTRPGAGSGCECVREGSGSSSDPFIISNWRIIASSDNAISISQTTVHFVVLNVVVNVTGAYYGVALRNVANGTIQDSSFTGGGISLHNSKTTSILNNTITDSVFGILVEASDNNIIKRNKLDRIRQVGIFNRASGNLIEGNHVTNGSFGGINIDGMTGFGDDNRILNNLVEGNANYGIGLWEARNNSIRGNIVSRNGVGIMLTASCADNLLEQNNVANNTADGILVDEQSTKNKITGNTTAGNGNGTTSFDLHDKGSDNVWLANTFNTRRPDTIS